MQTTQYDRLYSVSVDDFINLDKKLQDKFIFQGSSNWDIYLSDRTNCNSIDILENVALLSFKQKQEFEDYITQNNIIDYSLEHIAQNEYLVLVNNG
jgi:hypothetical protein